MKSTACDDFIAVSVVVTLFTQYFRTFRLSYNWSREMKMCSDGKHYQCGWKWNWKLSRLRRSSGIFLEGRRYARWGDFGNEQLQAYKYYTKRRLESHLMTTIAREMHRCQSLQGRPSSIVFHRNPESLPVMGCRSFRSIVDVVVSWNWKRVQ